MNLFFQFVSEYWYLFAAMASILLLLAANQVLNPANRKVSVLELGRKVNDSDGLILDVSTEGEFKSSHIAGAKNLPFSRIDEADSAYEKFKGKPVVIVCQTGQRSGAAAGTLLKQGFVDVYSLQGGMAEWKRENMPVVRSKKAEKTSTKSKKAKAKAKSKKS